LTSRTSRLNESLATQSHPKADIGLRGRMLGAVNLDEHSDQTFIGRIERGFRRSQ
jgi:hypothetical protein